MNRVVLASSIVLSTLIQISVFFICSVCVWVKAFPFHCRASFEIPLYLEHKCCYYDNVIHLVFVSRKNEYFSNSAMECLHFIFFYYYLFLFCNHLFIVSMILQNLQFFTPINIQNTTKFFHCYKIGFCFFSIRKKSKRLIA